MSCAYETYRQTDTAIPIKHPKTLFVGGILKAYKRRSEAVTCANKKHKQLTAKRL